MNLLADTQRSPGHPCPYLEGKEARYRSFVAAGVDANETDALLERGWRLFGNCFFRPDCDSCRECVPLRIPVQTFSPSKSQKKIIKRNRETVMSTGKPVPTGELYRLYARHERFRFDHATTIESFVSSFYALSAPALQVEYRIGATLVGAGICLCSRTALSSVYFFHAPEYARFGLGIYSICREIAVARKMGFLWYYLGYFIAENRSMNYKGRFFPHQRMDWDTGEWKTVYRNKNGDG